MIKKVLGNPSIDSFLMHQGHNLQRQLVEDFKIPNLIHGITLNGKYEHLVHVEYQRTIKKD